jgi:hypothetical protein
MKGFLGDGSVHLKSKGSYENHLVSNVYIKPDISRDILEKIFIFNKAQAIFSYLLKNDTLNP